MTGFVARHRGKLATLAVVAVAPFALHEGTIAATTIDAPTVAVPDTPVAVDPANPDLRTAGPAYARHRGEILEVRLAGSPERIGVTEPRLLRPEMLENEGILWGELDRRVPSRLARTLLLDLGRLRFRHVDRNMSDAHRREIAAEALGFTPDPWAERVPTFQRMTFLQALYDISLSFERSPLIGCTSFALTGDAAEDGHTLLARNFDFEVADVFDRGKAVFLVREDGAIPYASVAWPGLVGAVSGMNAEGLALVVHGGRASAPSVTGEPVVHTMRDVLGHARDVEEAVRMLSERRPMVSHLVMVADAAGRVAIVERAPGVEAFVRRGSGKVPLTNHFEGPLANDPANVRVREKTSTLARRERLDERLAALPPHATIADAVDVLRDRKGAHGVALPVGDRRAIDALIATHAVVMDATARALWVSEGPHLQGRFVKFDLRRLLADDYDPRSDHDVVALPAEPEPWPKAVSPAKLEAR